jgi:hypothetical protein
MSLQENELPALTSAFVRLHNNIVFVSPAQASSAHLALTKRVYTDSADWSGLSPSWRKTRAPPLSIEVFFLLKTKKDCGPVAVRMSGRRLGTIRRIRMTFCVSAGSAGIDVAESRFAT